jgi:hypothetical protein
MKKNLHSARRIIAAGMLLAFIPCFRLAGQTDQDVLIRDIVREPASFQGKTLYLKLRFKTLDDVFNTITFYDRKNIDITFDFEIQKTMPEYRNEILNLHRGLEYIVTFIVNGVSEQGIIEAELVGFKPDCLLKLPDGAPQR